MADFISPYELSFPEGRRAYNPTYFNNFSNSLLYPGSACVIFKKPITVSASHPKNTLELSGRAGDSIRTGKVTFMIIGHGSMDISCKCSCTLINGTDLYVQKVVEIIPVTNNPADATIQSWCNAHQIVGKTIAEVISELYADSSIPPDDPDPYRNYLIDMCDMFVSYLPGIIDDNGSTGTSLPMCYFGLDDTLKFTKPKDSTSSWDDSPINLPNSVKMDSPIISITDHHISSNTFDGFKITFNKPIYYISDYSMSLLDLDNSTTILHSTPHWYDGVNKVSLNSSGSYSNLLIGQQNGLTEAYIADTYTASISPTNSKHELRKLSTVLDYSSDTDRHYRLLVGTLFWGSLDVYSLSTPTDYIDKLGQPISSIFDIDAFYIDFTVSKTNIGTVTGYGQAEDLISYFFPNYSVSYLDLDVSTASNISINDKKLNIDLSKTPLKPGSEYTIHFEPGSILNSNGDPISVPDIRFKTNP